MSLIVVLTNISQLADISDYRYQVMVGDGSPNSHIIAEGTVAGHKRANGWKTLVRKLLQEEAAS